MARNMYGATSADFTLTSGGRVVPGATLTIWSARTGGTQITDLLDRDSVATTTVTSDADGSIVYYGPNNDKTVHWADSGVGNRIAVRPTDITGDPPVLSIGTVGTGAAAASLTGTSEAPVLNLTLPSAGANGVDTAAIQDGAVTAAKLGSDVRIGNLLTLNQATGTDTLAATTGFTAYNDCTIASSTTYAAAGSRSLAATATGSGAVIAGTSEATAPSVVGSDTYTASFALRASAAVGGVRICIQWVEAGVLATLTQSTSFTTSTSGFVTYSLTATAPAAATGAVVFMYATGGSTAGTVFYLDKFQFARGAAGTFALPGTVVTGQSHIATNGAVHLSGTGSPEGVVTAAPGSTWLQTDATTDVKGWIRWVKASGTGNTGWVAGPEADTGWRALTLEGDWTGTAYIIRGGRRVTFKFYNLTGTAGTAAFTLPTGFRLGTPSVGSATQLAATGSTAGTLAISSAAGVSKVEPLGGARGYTGTFLEVSWVTDDAWPTSLPGSAA